MKRRVHFLLILLLVSFNGFAQQNLPDRIIGKIPDTNSEKLYQIQIGAFAEELNAHYAGLRLKNLNLNTVEEKYSNYTRVIVKGVNAGNVNNTLAIIKQAGFNEVIIREDEYSPRNVPNSISEKWEINSPGSAYASFEFNSDMNYIVVENNRDKSTRFGEYNMPDTQTINMNDFGTVKLQDKNNDNTGVNFSFSSSDEPNKPINLSASRVQNFTDTQELDLFCRTWKVVRCSEPESIGYIFVFSKAGTYLVTAPNGQVTASARWRWYGNNKGYVEYSHDNWVSYGRATINELKLDSLKIFDPGYYGNRPGYSKGILNINYELSPGTPDLAKSPPPSPAPKTTQLPVNAPSEPSAVPVPATEPAPASSDAVPAPPPPALEPATAPSRPRPRLAALVEFPPEGIDLPLSKPQR